MNLNLPNQWVLAITPLTNSPDAFKVEILYNNRLVTFCHNADQNKTEKFCTILATVFNYKNDSVNEVGIRNEPNQWSKMLEALKRHLNNRTRNRWPS